MRYLLASIFVLCVFLSPAHSEPQWFKGVTHMHSLWSDGDQAPEMIAKWYKEHGYNFICFSEHNVLQQGDKFVSIVEESKLDPKRAQEITDTFGEDWVVTKTGDKNPRMKLKTHDELSAYFNEAGKFLLVNAEEVTSIGQSPHFNIINLKENIVPARGPVSKVLQGYVDTLNAQSKSLGIPIIGHLNHLNFSDGVTSEEVLGVKGMRFMEIYNGHPGVHTWGHAGKFRPSSERHWDIILSMKQKNEPGEPLYGVSTDDSHEYHEWGAKFTNPGRGWVMVRAESLDANALVEAMDRGDFYASTGVSLKDVKHDAKALTVSIDAKPGVTYTTRFIGTKKGFDSSSAPVLDENGKERERTTRVYNDTIGQILFETTENPATYTFKGDEIYVRATVISSETQDNAVYPEDKKMAWAQPVMLP